MDEDKIEQILSSIFKLKKDESKTLWNPIDKISSDLPDLSIDIINSALIILSNNKYVQLSKDDKLSYILINDTATGYLDLLKSKKLKENKRKWEARRWSIIQLVIGGVIGSKITIIARWIS